MDQADILRILIALLSLLAPMLIIILNHEKRHHLSWGDVLTRIGLGAVFIGIAYGAMEATVQGLGVYTRLYVLLGALVWVNTGLLVSIAHDRAARKRLEQRDAREKGAPTFP